MVSGNGSRLYALSRDSTVYAWSTNHLILGHAPEYSSSTSKKYHYGDNKTGLGPLYGLRHPEMRASTFYNKAALRSATADKPELIAVGSAYYCPVLFPTDETFLNREQPDSDDEHDEIPTPRLPTPMSSQPPRPGARRTVSGSGVATRLVDTIPIYHHGTALIRGHDRDVSCMTWTTEGNMVSLSDDFTARCWREGSMARDLRVGGEAEGRRWNCGWAEVEDGWDDDDE